MRDVLLLIIISSDTAWLQIDLKDRSFRFGKIKSINDHAATITTALSDNDSNKNKYEHMQTIVPRPALPIYKQNNLRSGHIL